MTVGLRRLDWSSGIAADDLLVEQKAEEAADDAPTLPLCGGGVIPFLALIPLPQPRCCDVLDVFDFRLRQRLRQLVAKQRSIEGTSPLPV